MGKSKVKYIYLDNTMVIRSRKFSKSKLNFKAKLSTHEVGMIIDYIMALVSKRKLDPKERIK